MTSMREAFKKAGYEEPEASEDYVEEARKVIEDLKEKLGRDYEKFTTTKIRNILAMVSEVYNYALYDQSEVLSESIKKKLAAIKVRLIYECGREKKTVKPFVERAGLMKKIDEIGNSRSRLIDFSRYMEALVAYHLFYDGKD